MKQHMITVIILVIMSISLIAKDSKEAQTAKVFYDNKNYDSAIDWYKKAVEKYENNSDLYLWLAKSYLADINNVNFMSKGLYSSKIKKYLKLSIEKNPKNIDAYYYLASFYFNAPYIAGGDKDEAWLQVEKIAKLSPIKGLEIKGQFYVQEKQFDKALASFEEVLKIDPASMGSLYQVGKNTVFTKKNLDRGIECLIEYTKHKPVNPLPSLDGAYWRLAQIYQIKGDKNKAKESIAKAIKINPDDEYKKLLKEL